MKKSLQQIDDFYYQKGLRDKELRDALDKDAQYQQILAERKSKLRARFDISKEDEDKYVLSTDHDWEILGACLELEKKNLSKSDRELVKFIKSQLELDWRKQLTVKIEELLKKYRI